MELKPDPVWTSRYERERRRIRSCSDPIDVFHIGSTAIPDIPGRPQLDVIAVYDDSEIINAAADELLRQGDRWQRNESNGIVVVYWRDPPEAVYLRLHTADDESVARNVAFREYLRENETARQEYEQVKRDAADAHDRFQPYQEAKSETVRRLTKQAHEAGYIERLPDTIRP
jgi:Uncharacterized conserved protein